MYICNGILICIGVLFLSNVSGQNWMDYIESCTFKTSRNQNGSPHQCQGIPEIVIEEKTYGSHNFWCITVDNRNNQLTNQILNFGLTTGYGIAFYSAEGDDIQWNSAKVRIHSGEVRIALYKHKETQGNLARITSLDLNGKNLCSGTSNQISNQVDFDKPSTTFNVYNDDSYRFLNDCVYRSRSNRNANKCESVNEIQVERREVRGETYWCILFNNQNGKYNSNQILSIQFDSISKRTAWEPADINVGTDRFKLDQTTLRIAYSPYSRSDSVPNLTSIKIDNRELCNADTVETVSRPKPKPRPRPTPTLAPIEPPTAPRTEPPTVPPTVPPTAPPTKKPTTRPPRREITCGERPALAREALVSSGERVPAGSYPWHCGLYKRERHGSAPYFCGGTLINSNTVITAAHCIVETAGAISPDRLLVKLGTININTLGQFGRDYNVGQLKVHHNNENFQHDIAILRLKTVVEFTSYIVPICYSNEDFDYVDQPGKVPGWGLTENQDLGLSEYLNVASMPGKSEEVCKEENPDFFKNYLNTDNQLCAGNLNGTSVCKGDSGGGLVFQRGKKWYLRGIVSISPGLNTTEGIDKCDITQYVVFTDVVKHYEWIQTTILNF